MSSASIRSRHTPQVEGTRGEFGELVTDFLTAVEASQILHLLGIEEPSRELRLIAKELAGEIAMELSTGKYVDGLASSVRAELGTLWEVEGFKGEYLEEALMGAIGLRKLMWNASSEYVTLEARGILECFTKAFGKELKEVKILSKISSEGDAGKILQAMATSILVAVGGLDGV